MGTEQQAEGSEQTNGGNPAIGIVGKVEERFRELKKHAETYPYVWGSYAVVYGGFGLWFAYRWRRLRKTEDRVRVLQERLRQLAQAEESGTTSSSASTKVDKPVMESGSASSSAPSKLDKPVTESASTSSSAPSKVDKPVTESASTSSTASSKADTPPQ